MNAADLIMIATFLVVVLGGLGYMVVRSMVAESPRARIRQRLMENVADVAPVNVDDEGAEPAKPRAQWIADSHAMKLVLRLKDQAEHMGGIAGFRTLILAAAAAAVVSAVLAHLAGLGLWVAVASALPGAALGGFATFTIMVQRYRMRFLNGLPDALDLVIRAVRAGVPVVHAIVTAGKELPYPVGREFRIMGDSLRLGMDQQDVMDAASKRIGIPDFQFFVVCLQLQRETGGPLADTLENLANIIRARREVRLKTQALTAQGRAASKIIAMVPVMVVVSLKMMGGDYVDILFDTEKGRHLLWTAAAMVVTGLTIISRMSKLED